MESALIDALTNLGPLGIVVILIVTGYLVPKPYYEREIARGDKATDTADKNAEALKTVVGTNDTLLVEVRALRADMRAKDAG